MASDFKVTKEVDEKTTSTLLSSTALLSSANESLRLVIALISVTIQFFSRNSKPTAGSMTFFSDDCGTHNMKT